ncbi:MAG TPA: hypothetical protein VFD42_07465, partial [Chloroflexota bacterium]|nr:hypothetical protein [Chloroflexota bacterium]
LYLMAARQVADTALAASDRGSGWRWVLASAATAVPIGVAIVLLNRLSNTTLEQPPVEFLFGEAGLILVGLLCFLFLLTGRERGALAWYSLAILAVGYLLHSSFFLSYREESLAFEPAAGTQLSPYLRDAARTAAYFSAHFGMPVTVDPGLRAATAWYLRDARDVRYGQDATDGSLIRLVAGDQASAQDGLPRRPGLYQPAIDARQLNWRGLWRWAVDRTGLVRANARDIIARTPSGNW